MEEYYSVDFFLCDLIPRFDSREIEDPDKQRKMEERENRRDKKKQQPKMKQLKVKAA